MEDFLLPLADLVEELEIGTDEGYSEIPLPPVAISALKRILSRQKCNKLTVEEIVLSLAEAEQIIQVFIYIKSVTSSEKTQSYKWKYTVGFYYDGPYGKCKKARQTGSHAPASSFF